MIVVCEASALRLRSLPVAEAGTDTGRRLIKDQTAQVYGKSLDSEWLYVDAPAGRGWSHSGYLVEFEAEDSVVLSPAWPSLPQGLAGIKRIFGEPGKAICSAGRVHLPKPLPLSWNLGTKIEVFACHKLLEDVLTSVFKELHRRDLWDAVENFGGCFNVRSITASQKTSTHAWGIAVDIDTLDNRLGRTPQMNARVIAIFEDHGFVWGGEWARPDGMHFQFATNY